MRHPLALAALAASLAAPAAHAQQRITKEPSTRPAPGRKAERPAPAPRPSAAAAGASAKSLADADVAFAQRAASAGLKDALLATLADDAVLFHPSAVPARAWTAATAFPAGQYTWAPAWAATSFDGSLGVTTGPIAFHSAAPDSSATGQYVTVWTRAAAGGPPKVLLQLVVPGPQAPEATFTAHQPAGDGRPRGGPGAAEASRATLFIADRGLAAAVRADGAPTAIARVSLPDTRLLRAGTLPAVGVDSIRAALAAHEGDSRAAWQITDLRMARSGDFGVAYGAYERRGAADALVETGNYVRVWERQPDGGWRILLDAMAPLTTR